MVNPTNLLARSFNAEQTPTPTKTSSLKTRVMIVASLILSVLTIASGIAAAVLTGVPGLCALSILGVFFACSSILLMRSLHQKNQLQQHYGFAYTDPDFCKELQQQ